jgi:hypothetical protein
MPEQRSPRFGRFGILSLLLCTLFVALLFAVVRTALLFGLSGALLPLVMAAGATLGAAIGCLGEKDDWILLGAILGLSAVMALLLAPLVLAWLLSRVGLF